MSPDDRRDAAPKMPRELLEAFFGWLRDRPATLIDYFQDDFLVVVDESHVTIPQIRGMYEGDRSRKKTLVEHGFRLPSALDNRPLTYAEFEGLVRRIIFVSATPNDFELRAFGGEVVEQIVRPTGLIDPATEVRPVKGQIDDLLGEIRARVEKRERVLVTTLTKRMAEDLTSYLSGLGVRVRYLHSDIHALDRIEILRGSRFGEFDVLVGINLLREGLDLPEVSRRGARRGQGGISPLANLPHPDGGTGGATHRGKGYILRRTVTGSMARAIDETNRRREKQIEYNRKHHITPRSIVKSVDEVMLSTSIIDAKRNREKEEALAAELFVPEGGTIRSS